MIKYEPLTYADKVTPYPVWSQVLGHLMSLTSILTIPAVAIWQVAKAPGKTLAQVSVILSDVELSAN